VLDCRQATPWHDCLLAGITWQRFPAAPRQV
jgi:hypothetical protein